MKAPDILLTMSKTNPLQVRAYKFKCLSLGFVNRNCRAKSNRKLQSSVFYSKTYNKALIYLDVTSLNVISEDFSNLKNKIIARKKRIS